MVGGACCGDYNFKVKNQSDPLAEIMISSNSTVIDKRDIACVITSNRIIVFILFWMNKGNDEF